jgi:hypothetical protein
MNPITKKIVNTPVVKNRLFLYAKFWLDSLVNKQKLIFQGRYINRIAEKLDAGNNKKTILCPTLYFLDRGLAWQVTIAKALELRGHDVIFMPLDIHFPRKNALYYDVYDGRYANDFFNLHTETLLKSFNMNIKGYSQFGSAANFKEYRKSVAKFSFSECKSFIYHDLPIGKMAFNSVMHFYRRGGTAFSDEEVEGYKDFLAIGMILYHTLSKVLDEIKTDVILTINGSFLDSQIQMALAKSRGIRVVTFETGFMLNSIVLAINEPTTIWPMIKYLPKEYNTYQLTADQNKTLDDYLTQRSLGQNCVLDYWGKPVFDHKVIRKEIGLDPDISPDVLFTNLQWDSTQIDCDIAFDSQVDWILETIENYKNHPERTLVIRVHPAEVTPIEIESKEKISDTIAKAYPQLPSNIFVIPAESKISSYPLTDVSNSVLVYASTTGLEAAIMGKTVLLAGKGHYRGQGFVQDVESKEQYFKLLDNLTSLTPSKETVNLARKYAYFFFFEFMIPFNLVKERTISDGGEMTAFNFKSESELLPSKNSSLDFIIDLILDKTSYYERLKRLIK